MPHSAQCSTLRMIDQRGLRATACFPSTQWPQSATDDRDGNIRQHHHLQQLEKAVRGDLEHTGLLSEKESYEGTGYKPDKEFGGRDHRPLADRFYFWRRCGSV